MRIYGNWVGNTLHLTIMEAKRILYIDASKPTVDVETGTYRFRFYNPLDAVFDGGSAGTWFTCALLVFSPESRLLRFPVDLVVSTYSDDIEDAGTEIPVSLMDRIMSGLDTEQSAYEQLCRIIGEPQ